MSGRATRCLFALVVALAAITGDARVALAQQPVAPGALPLRQAAFAWDKTLLRAGFSFKDIFDPQLTQKLSNGLPTDIAMRAYVWKDGDANPTALAVRSCHVIYDLWDEVYRVKVTDPSATRDLAKANTEGVLRECAEARDLPIVDRSLLTAGTQHFLAVIVDIDPVSPQMLAQMRAWVSRPTGSTGIAPGNALFGSFVGLFVRNIGASAKTLQFRTQTFVP